MKIQNILTLAATSALIVSASASITMDWVMVGNPGNAADIADGDSSTAGVQRYGSVAYAYQIGKYEVTNAQYGAFLNAKGASNSGSIYTSDMASYGITQTGISGSFRYTVTSGFENKPVVFVSWYDAARFSNWLGNGQGTGDMETGAYTLSGATTGIITVNSGATVHLPSENEWYKAAYYKAATASYSIYPNGQNTITKADANYESAGTTTVGSYSGDASPYGTFDQGGNVWEWTDGGTDPNRVLRGGAFYYGAGVDGLLSSTRPNIAPTTERTVYGFRVVSVPEPTSMLLSMVAGGMMLIRRKR